MAKNHRQKSLSPGQQEKLLGVLRARFEQHMARHPGISWDDAASALAKDPEKLWSLNEMERTGGEPDIVPFGNEPGVFIFCDCSPESPKGRRSLCYDRAALESRKEHKPADNALDMATGMGVELLTEAQYRELQQLGNFDTKTSSWLLTPAAIRAMGGAIFGDFRYGQTFIYHNGAESYYAARGFRGMLRVGKEHGGRIGNRKTAKR